LGSKIQPSRDSNLNHIAAIKLKQMRVVNWNVEWANAARERGRLIKEMVTGFDPEVICLTELVQGMMPSNGHVIDAEADYGYSLKEGRRKVALWSTHEWSQIDTVGHESMPGGRYISGVSQGIRFIGVCIPWRDAHVSTGRKNRKPWEDHLAYLSGLRQVLREKAKESYPVCVLGDFNQRIPRTKQPKGVYQALETCFNDDYQIVTRGMVDSAGKPLIDHIVVSQGFSYQHEAILPASTSAGIRLSDHSGTIGNIALSPC